jgi:steroid delta-isomerase-like uncharacterized protein
MCSQIRRILVPCLLLVVLGGVLQTAAADTEANKALIRDRWLDMVNTAKLATADEIFAADFTCHAPHYPQASDLAGYKVEVVSASTVIMDFQAVLEDLLAEGDTVVGRFTATGKWPPAGIPYTNTWIIFFRFADGKIAEEWWQYDLFGVQQQLGMIPSTRDDYTWGEPSTVSGDPGDPETNRALLQRFVDEIMNRQDFDLADELFAADYVMHTAMSPAEVRGPEGLKQMLGMYAAVFPDAHVTIEDTVAEGDKVAFRFTLTGTHEGELMGIPPTGRQITMTGNSIHRFADGKFAETWAGDDVLGMMLQLTAEEWPADGPWITTVPTPMGNMIIKGIWTAQDAAQTRLTGEFEQINVYPLLIDLYPDSERVKFAGALAVKTGLNQYDMTAIEYFTKTVGPGHEEIVGFGIVSGNLELTGPDSVQGQGTGAYYLPSQDADQDGFPDDGQEPALCVPWTWTAKRLTMMPPCVPTPPAE